MGDRDSQKRMIGVTEKDQLIRGGERLKSDRDAHTESQSKEKKDVINYN